MSLVKNVLVVGSFTVLRHSDLGAWRVQAPSGEEIGQLALRAFSDNEVQSYGKGGIVGLNGEQEHASALLTTAFANPSTLDTPFCRTKS
jgi:hypothetical protein